MKNFINKVIEDRAEEILKKLPKESIDFIITDPPYFIAHESSLIRRTKHTKFKGTDIFFNEEWDKQWKDREEYKKWLKYILRELYRVLKPDRHIIMWIDKLMLSYIMEWWQEFGGKYRSPFFWQKSNPSPRARKVDAMKSIEVAFWGTKGRVKQEFYNWQLGFLTDVIKCAIPRKEGAEKRHPTQKPLHLAFYLLAYLSKPNDIVLDPFCGSGTFLVASRLMGRNFIGVDFTSEWVQIAVKRLNNLEVVKDKFDKFLKEMLAKKERRDGGEEAYYLLTGQKIPRKLLF